MVEKINFKSLENKIQTKQFMPIYLFQGEESYYIDLLTNLLIQLTLNEKEKIFNQVILYGLETNVANIINICRRYPIVGEKQLVVIKEAQTLKNIDNLVFYVKNPLQSTILVINYKNGKLDKSKKLIDEIAKVGIIFESKKIYDNKIPGFIIDFLKKKQIEIDVQAVKFLVDRLGNNLGKLVKELDKLSILLPYREKRITIGLVEKNIGMSKDFNNFELQKAISTKNILKINCIASYFEQNQKDNPLTLILVLLFDFFVNLMICQYEKNKSKDNLIRVLGFKWDFQIIDYIQAMRYYKPVKTMNNISLIRQYDAKIKRIKNSYIKREKLLTEILYKLIH
ncbi:MAG: DNA polymerase III subunit delta [Bacteroidales bacterium OttesenSCG-928-I14]|jgi:DNA polymerase-3 subunit delta|nr:DNA polymerase III subunit delta [Bacteroidales bacterium OttesenSCG-928-I14]